MNHRCAVREEDLGPFLLGQLDPEQEAAMAELVATCPYCADEIQRLRPVVATMGAGSPPPDLGDTLSASRPSALHLRAPAGGLREVLASIGRERRGRAPRRLVLALAAAAAAAAVAAGVAASMLLPSATDREVTLARPDTPEARVGDASGVVHLDEKPWGTAMVLEASGLRPGQAYGVWLERREGGRLPAGSFVPDGGGAVRLDLSSGLALGESQAVGIALLPGGGADPVDVLSAALD